MGAVVIGFVVLSVLCGALAAIAYGLHVALRPRTTGNLTLSDALRAFEPRGGRPRYPVRLFEACALSTTWLAAVPVLLLALGATHQGAPARAAVGAVLLALTVSTWWAWRRGVLRPLSHREPARLLSLPSRRERG